MVSVLVCYCTLRNWGSVKWDMKKQQWTGQAPGGFTTRLRQEILPDSGGLGGKLRNWNGGKGNDRER